MTPNQLLLLQILDEVGAKPISFVDSRFRDKLLGKPGLPDTMVQVAQSQHLSGMLLMSMFANLLNVGWVRHVKLLRGDQGYDLTDQGREALDKAMLSRNWKIESHP